MKMKTSLLRLILLDMVKGRWEFPDLRRRALQQYKYWQPESVIVESKATGLPLTYELRQMDIPVVNFHSVSGQRQARSCQFGCTFVRIWYDMGAGSKVC